MTDNENEALNLARQLFGSRDTDEPHDTDPKDQDPDPDQDTPAPITRRLFGNN